MIRRIIKHTIGTERHEFKDIVRVVTLYVQWRMAACHLAKEKVQLDKLNKDFSFHIPLRLNVADIRL